MQRDAEFHAASSRSRSAARTVATSCDSSRRSAARRCRCAGPSAPTLAGSPGPYSETPGVPSAAARWTSPESSATPIVLSIAPGPTYSVNAQPIPPDELIPRLAAIYDGRPDKVLFIDAARAVPYRDVFWVYGAVRSAGVRVTAIVPPSASRTTVK